MDTKELKSVADVLHHNWELGSGGVGKITLGTYSPQQDQLSQMSANLKTQDNAGTADPMFVVFQKQLVSGLESGYEDFWLWVSDDDGDYEEAAKDAAVVLARLHAEGGPLVIGARTYRRTGCKYIEKFCAAFLTQKGADDYLSWNGHNLTQPYVYVHGMYRNAEMIAVRNYFMGKE
jgi:hypothetical protein